jgi:hypothetical protein
MNANERERVSHARGAGISGGPASASVGGSGGAKPPGQGANERERVSHARGAGISGVPASVSVGGSGGAKPPGQE